MGQQKASAIGENGRFRLGGVTVTLGRFIYATAIVRTRNEVADVSSSWNAIPYAQLPTYHEPEFRGSARNSPLALLVEGEVNPVTKVSASPDGVSCMERSERCRRARNGPTRRARRSRERVLRKARC